MNPLRQIQQALQWRIRAHHLRSFVSRLRTLSLRRPFVVIAMPGSLHVANLAIRKIPTDVDRLIVLNGLPSWEAKLARKVLGANPTVRCCALMEHDQVLDLLFDNLNTDFGILDYDCFVLQPDYFHRMRQLAPDAFMNACFSRTHPASGQRVPETFFLFFDRERIRNLVREFSVTCRPVKWQALNHPTQEALNPIGINAECLPEAHKDYFDTLRVIMMLGIAKGQIIDYCGNFPATPTPSGQLFHVGGISSPNKVDGIWRFRGAYFWRRVLESCKEPELKKRYQRIYGVQTANDLRARYPEWSQQVSAEFFEFCDQIIMQDLAVHQH